MRHALIVAALASVSVAATPAITPRPGVNSKAVPSRVARNAPSPLASYVAGRLPGIYDLAQSDLKRAVAEADQAFVLLVTYGTERDADAFREAAAARRLLLQLDAVDPEQRKELLPYLREHDELAKHMAFTVPSTEKAKTAYALLARLIKERPQVVGKLPNLAAAIAVVHDKPLERRVNENKVKAADPVALLDYYATNESRMFFGLRNMPPDLLAYVVNTTCSVNDLTWANRNYAGNRNVGELFFNVRYDWNAFTLRSTKEVTKQGYTLPNILKYGGVCADQAYFATEVAKAIGVPAAYTRGADAEVSHAWVGFLQNDARGLHWNFDAGRYESYRNVRGDVVDPITRDNLPDSYVTLLAESATASPASLQTAAAYAEAAFMLIPEAAGPIGVVTAGNSSNVPTLSTKTSATGALLSPPKSATSPKSSASGPAPAIPPELAEAGLVARPRTIQSALDLIEMGLHQNESYAPGWSAVGRLAESGEMSLDQKRRWAGLIQKLCGQKYPDFAVALLDPMIRTVDDSAAQSRLWDALYASVQQARPDLAAQVRIRQGEMWEKKGDMAKAGQAYEDVIRRYVNTSPYALTAVQKAEGLLKQIGQQDKVLTLYKQAATAVMRPDSMMAPEFMKQSNWYKIRAAYARKLEEAGRSNEARAVLPEENSTLNP